MNDFISPYVKGNFAMPPGIKDIYNYYKSENHEPGRLCTKIINFSIGALGTIGGACFSIFYEPRFAPFATFFWAANAADTIYEYAKHVKKEKRQEKREENL